MAAEKHTWSPTMPLTAHSLELFDLGQHRAYMYGVEEWLGTAGIRWRQWNGEPGRRRSESLVAVRSAKPSVASSGFHDFHMVLSQDSMGEAIMAVGSGFDEMTIDPTVGDTKRITGI